MYIRSRFYCNYYCGADPPSYPSTLSVCCPSCEWRVLHWCQEYVGCRVWSNTQKLPLTPDVPYPWATMCHQDPVCKRISCRKSPSQSVDTTINSSCGKRKPMTGRPVGVNTRWADWYGYTLDHQQYLVGGPNIPSAMAGTIYNQDGAQ